MHAFSLADYPRNRHLKKRLTAFLPYCWKEKSWLYLPEPVFLNVYGAPELIPRNEFRQPM
jgi:hypothetical protein